MIRSSSSSTLYTFVFDFATCASPSSSLILSRARTKEGAICCNARTGAPWSWKLFRARSLFLDNDDCIYSVYIVASVRLRNAAKVAGHASTTFMPRVCRGWKLEFTGGRRLSHAKVHYCKRGVVALGFGNMNH